MLMDIIKFAIIFLFVLLGAIGLVIVVLQIGKYSSKNLFPIKQKDSFMLTAKETKEKSKFNFDLIINKEVDELLEKIKFGIQENCNKGKFYYNIDVGNYHNETIEKVINYVTKLGYKCKDSDYFAYLQILW